MSSWLIALPIALGAIFLLRGIQLFLHQKQRIRRLEEELAGARREISSRFDLDPLTGLLNQSALAKRMEQEECFPGVVAVCDLDDFKRLNDSLGHLVGDEILGSIGNLIRSSIRQQDAAFRWGGDEFVIFFSNQDQDLVHKRMRSLEERLNRFHIRNHGAVSISFSWGTASTEGRSLRESLDAADHEMYEFKRSRSPEAPGTRTQHPAIDL